MSKVTPSNNKGSFLQKNHHSGKFRGNQISGSPKQRGGMPILPETSAAESIPPQEKFHKELNILESKVTVFPEYIDSSLIPYLRAKVKLFRRGQLSLHIHEWEKLTLDASILQSISGECIKFISQPPDQVAYPPNSIPRDYKSLIDEEISSLQDKSVSVSCVHEPREFISPIFTVPKKDSTVTLIASRRLAV